MKRKAEDDACEIQTLEAEEVQPQPKKSRFDEPIVHLHTRSQPAEILYNSLSKKVLSEDLHESHSMPVSAADAEEMRIAYDSLINQPDGKEQLLLVAEALKTNFQETEGSGLFPVLPQETNFVLKLQEKVIEFPNPLPNVITVGRLPACDLSLPFKLPEFRHLSRLHVVIFPLYEIGKLLICDVGSMNGIKMKERSGIGPLVHSVVGDRRVILVGIDETVVFLLGNITLILSPKACIVCYDASREIAFQCGHFTCCSQCSQKLTKCPICQQPVSRRKLDYMAINTMVAREEHTSDST